MIRRLFVYFTVVLTLCFIISCKKDSPSVDGTNTKKELNEASDATNKDDLVIRDDTASITDTVQQDKHSPLSADSVSCETEVNHDSELNSQSDTRVYDVAEQLPEFPGGLQSLNKYISENTRDISKSVHVKKPVRTMISFIVEKDGTLTQPQVAKSSGVAELDKAAVNLVQNMPEWTPAKNDGICVRMKYLVPVIFNPQN